MSDKVPDKFERIRLQAQAMSQPPAESEFDECSQCHGIGEHFPQCPRKAKPPTESGEVTELVEVNQTISSDRAHFEHAFRSCLEPIKRLTGERNEAQEQLTAAKAENDRLRKVLSEVKCYCCGELAVRM